MASGCNECFSYVEFNNVLPTDTAIHVNGGVYPVQWTVDDLVDNNPQFFYKPGIMGIYTLCTHVQIVDVDLVLSATRDNVGVISTAGFIGGRPDDRHK